jgi:hypothetical protein
LSFQKTNSSNEKKSSFNFSVYTVKIQHLSANIEDLSADFRIFSAKPKNAAVECNSFDLFYLSISQFCTFTAKNTILSTKQKNSRSKAAAKLNKYPCVKTR